MSSDVNHKPASLDIKAILEILPHRFPFIFIDKVIEVDYEKGYIIGQKNLSFNEAFFQGHFPDDPIMPGVLIMEALAQTGAIFVCLSGHSGRKAFLLNINNAKFRQPVRPGDILMLRTERLHMTNKAGRFKAEAFVNDKIVAEAEIGFVFREDDKAQKKE
jgi:3-hydroxyacyl-[acyl-carrier-protein] dehydratase